MEQNSGRKTELVGGGRLERFSSRLGRLSNVYLKDRLAGATEYIRIAGYFRSSIFELVNEEIGSIGRVRIVCNSDLDPEDINAAKQAREQLLKEKWNDIDDAVESFQRRPRYRKLFEMLTRGNVEVRVVARTDAPFLHGKAGVISKADGSSTAFMGSLNETRQGWSENYELVWEDSSADGIAWVREEFEHLWERGKPLPDAIVEEIKRSADRVEISLPDLLPSELAPAALVESNLYRRGEQLMPWQRAFVSLFLHHREIYGAVRLLLADEVGVGKTLSLAGAALVSSLLGDGPVVILCPATLTSQWQLELKDKLNIPSAVWLSGQKAWQIDPDELPLPSVGAAGILECPRQIAIVSTGLIFHMTEERRHLLSARYGLIILDEAHRARGARQLGRNEREPNNLLSFMLEIARRSRHVLLGTATPVQTDVEDLWELMRILGQKAEYVLGDAWSKWATSQQAVPVLTGASPVVDEREAWELFRNPIPPSSEQEVIFGLVRSALSLENNQYISAIPYSQIPDPDGFLIGQFQDDVLSPRNGLSFFQRNNPVVRHVVLRKRAKLEEMGLLPRIPVDIHPIEGETLPGMFDGLALRTSSSFDVAYQAAEDFTAAFGKRQKSAGLLKGLVRQRLCSSFAAGVTTARKLLDGRQAIDDEETLELIEEDVVALAEEREHLEAILGALGSHSTDPKLDAILFFLLTRGWLELGCIVFSQYYDTTRWIGEKLSQRFTTERPGLVVAVYAGAGKSGVLIDGEWKSVERDSIKRGVKEKIIKMVVATDAACEGLNLQSLGTLINVDLPWNPSRLEQRIGRIKRFGQRRDRVDMLNLVYQGTIDEKIYEKLSERMRDRYDVFGTLPDVIEDDWIEDIENIDERMREYTRKRERANAFDLRYAADVETSSERWELCERVLARHDVLEQLSRGWRERSAERKGTKGG